ncbi:MAG: DUF4287 domain-containing protein [Arenimonas sp.]
MSSADQALATQLANIEKRTGKTLAQLTELVKKCGKSKHGEIRDWLKSELGMGHGDANTLVHVALKSDGASAATEKNASTEDVLAEIYSGPKVALRPIHDALMSKIEKFGEFEIAPKKGYVSLRRKKQFAMLGPATTTRFELGLNLKETAGTDRLLEQLPKGMCSHKVKMSDAKEADAEVIAWIKRAYDQAG